MKQSCFVEHPKQYNNNAYYGYMPAWETHERQAFLSSPNTYSSQLYN